MTSPPTKNPLALVDKDEGPTQNETAEIDQDMQNAGMAVEVELSEEEEDLSQYQVEVDEGSLNSVFAIIKQSTYFESNPDQTLDQVMSLYSLLVACITKHKFSKDKTQLLEVCSQFHPLTREGNESNSTQMEGREKQEDIYLN
jgi:hypothetical protein